MRGHQVGRTHLGAPGGGRPGALCPPRCPPPVVPGSINYLYSYKNSSQSFVPIWELLFLHKNNTMVVLRKTALVQVSFIQIMQIRVQNKRKSVRRSRYDGYVSVIEKVYRSRAVKINNSKGTNPKVVNGKRIKHYFSGTPINVESNIIQTMTPEEHIKETFRNTAESWKKRRYVIKQ